MISRGGRAVAALPAAFRQLRFEDLRDLWAAERALAWAQLMVWRRPRGALLVHGAASGESAVTADVRRHSLVADASAVRLGTALHDAATGLSASPRLEQRHHAERLARAVRIAARVGPIRPACLARALALQRLLEARGIVGTSVCIGARLRGARFEAHAWVEYAGAVVGDDPLARHFAPLCGRPPQATQRVRFT